MANFTGIEILMLVTACIFIGAGVVTVFDMRFESGVDVQAMRFACVEAGYNDSSVRFKMNPAPACLPKLIDVTDINSCQNGFLKECGFVYFGKWENRIILKNGKYVVQTEETVTDWTTVQSKGVEE